MQYIKYIYKVYPHQQLNNKLMIHILQLLLVQTLKKSVQKRVFCWVSNFEHFEAIIHLVFCFFIWPLTMQLTNDHDLQNLLHLKRPVLYFTVSVWTGQCYIKFLYRMNLQQEVQTTCHNFRSRDMIYRPFSPDCICIWSILLNSAIPHSS